MTTCSITAGGKCGRMEEEMALRVLADVPDGLRRSEAVRTRMRKRPVERKSVKC